MVVFLYILIGLLAGTVGGALGVGGGVVMVPILVLLFGLTQHQAQGTALAVMMAPVFILAVLRYYHAGNVKVQMAIFIAMGFVFGALLGAHLVQSVPSPYLKKIFGIFLILVGIKMVLFK
ncbi:MAG: sulfite exporter TauE/SafE family protein [Candidatus Omnitrophota bacterium]|nr:sulfite exporter TauE/SafE family protein [Candidatus Omnitrophota bacterium]